ncbi:unnamed protein product [Strongylus vulgaris]|uniref:Uncharacterized protein n=1 Tax=Strongylus vulgaris TaxID=40348 RepID=A0A3P7KPJ4_STRVU|nr:unnamed protein product [Strongylus vulgaris]
MEKELSNALTKGLPFPIIKVIEYLSGDGFSWGRQYRVAGYYTAYELVGYVGHDNPLFGRLTRGCILTAVLLSTRRVIKSKMVLQ